MAQEQWELDDSSVTVNVFPDVASFPATGVSGEYYLDESTEIAPSNYEGDLYKWNGTAYTSDVNFVGHRPTRP